MKKFYVNAIAFTAVLFLVILGLDILSMQEYYQTAFAEWTDSTAYIGVGTDEIRPYIEKARAEDGTTKLILGDSVCRQMLLGVKKLNPDISMLGSNGAITMTGQYLLAKEYLDHHPSATDVFLIVLPESLGRTFDTKWGYQYTVMPFVEADLLKDLDDNTIEIMGNTYGKLFLNKQIVRALCLSSVNRKLYLNTLKDHTPGYVLSNHFELADQYVVKIADLCKSRGVNFYLYPCPVSEKVKERKVDRIREEFINSKIYSINPKYLDMIYFYPAEQSQDGVHFSGDYKNQTVYNSALRKILSGEPILDYLTLE